MILQDVLNRVSSNGSTGSAPVVRARPSRNGAGGKYRNGHCGARDQQHGHGDSNQKRLRRRVHDNLPNFFPQYIHSLLHAIIEAIGIFYESSGDAALRRWVRASPAAAPRTPGTELPAALTGDGLGWAKAQEPRRAHAVQRFDSVGKPPSPRRRRRPVARCFADPTLAMRWSLHLP